MLRPIRFQRLLLERLKEPGGKDQRRLNNSNMKYGIRVSRNAKEVVQFDRENGNPLWENAILKELGALISMGVFKKKPL